MQVLDIKVFQTPKWFQYTTSVASVAIAGLIRFYWSGALGTSGPYVFFTFAVALSAFLGGIGPGIISTALSLVCGYVLFIVPDLSSGNEPFPTAVLISANALVWLFLIILCDLLRRTALGHRKTLSDRDQYRERLHTIFDSMKDGFFAADSNWTITHSNRSFSEFLGLTNEELKGKSFWDVMAPYKSELQESFENAKAMRQTAEVDLFSDDGQKCIQCQVFPDRFGMSGYCRDITAQKRSDDQRERLLNDEKIAREEAERAGKLKDEFIATLSHELRTPLTAILGWAELLRAEPDLKPRISEGLEAIERSTKQQVELIEELLDASRISMGKVQLDLEILDLVELLQQVVEVFEPSANSKGVNLEWTCKVQEAWVRGDFNRLLQVFNNVVANSIKFTPNGGKVEIFLQDLNPMLSITVKDTGQGIDPGFIQYLFERFRQADATTTREHGGLGLGLSIAKQILDLHGASIHASSDGLGKGTTITIFIPNVKVRPQDVPYRIAPHMSEMAIPSGTRILIVEDDRGTREFIEASLTSSGAEVLAVDSATSALDVFQQFEPRLLLSDIGMPEMDGYELIRSIRKIESTTGYTTPAIALSAFTRDEERARALEAGFQIFLEKPVERTVLFRAINRLLDTTAQVNAKVDSDH